MAKISWERGDYFFVQQGREKYCGVVLGHNRVLVCSDDHEKIEVQELPPEGAVPTTCSRGDRSAPEGFTYEVFMACRGALAASGKEI